MEVPVGFSVAARTGVDTDDGRPRWFRDLSTLVEGLDTDTRTAPGNLALPGPATAVAPIGHFAHIRGDRLLARTCVSGSEVLLFPGLRAVGIYYGSARQAVPEQASDVPFPHRLTVRRRGRPGHVTVVAQWRKTASQYGRVSGFPALSSRPSDSSRD